jgi:putative ubiquitin-RnfH superfamily antitoxin RatB of RatAB toxin-antitoxin module
MIAIEVAYALPERQKIIALSVTPGTTAQQAIEESNLQQLFPEITATPLSIGVFSRKVPLDYIVQPGDRIEIYRPLAKDPMDARRNRVKTKPRKGYSLSKRL